MSFNVITVHGIRSWALCSKRNHFAEESGSLFRSRGSRDHVQPRRKDFVSFEHAKAANVSKDHVSWCHMEISIPWKKWWMLGEAEHEGWKMLEDAGRCWKMLEDAGRCWKMLEDAGRCWKYVWACCTILSSCSCIWFFHFPSLLSSLTAQTILTVRGTCWKG